MDLHEHVKFRIVWKYLPGLITKTAVVAGYLDLVSVFVHQASTARAFVIIFPAWVIFHYAFICGVGVRHVVVVERLYFRRDDAFFYCPRLGFIGFCTVIGGCVRLRVEHIPDGHAQGVRTLVCFGVQVVHLFRNRPEISVCVLYFRP